ncbi:EIF2D [Branchiostoma lanceolatum]|uniref:EIF2D protein n=1 Tax=Branchiostoma lanceolatum TaxID=7740 RepID=A0A8J9YZ22_BRALA|nr:EIF2D [Branchiostoma lanceolatum]
MFQKPFRVKSKTVIRGSDRRKLRADVGKALPSLTEDQLQELVPTKEDMSTMKLYTHAGKNVTVYCLGNNPVFFELDKNVFPTVYSLWRVPDMLPCLTTWPNVLKNLCGGADLMLPGVIEGAEGLPVIDKNKLCAISLLGNSAPVAVGRTTMSSAQMAECGMRGKGVTVLHTYLDQLWEHGDQTPLPTMATQQSCPEGHVPDLDPRDTASEEQVKKELGAEASSTTDTLPIENLVLEDDFGNKGDLEKENDLDKENTEGGMGDDGNGCGKEGETKEEEEEEEEVSPADQMDALLYQCFLHALKTNVKKTDLPLLTSKLLRGHMQPCCPAEKSLDLKKSSYKKLSKFLQAMQAQGLLQVKELSKGVESVVGVNWGHVELKSFEVPDIELPAAEVPDPGPGAGPTYQPPEVVEMYSVTGNLAPLFRTAGIRKGHALSGQEVREFLTQYVKENELMDPNNRRFIVVDPLLCDALRQKGENLTHLTWEDLFTRCCDKMSPCAQLVFPGQPPVLKKGKLEPVDVQVQQRSGNKKVTLIYNLEGFGIRPDTFAHLLQLRVQASTAVNPAVNRKAGMQVMVQGNQVSTVAKLLIDEMKLPKKFVQGVEKAAKKKR